MKGLSRRKVRSIKRLAQIMEGWLMEGNPVERSPRDQVISPTAFYEAGYWFEFALVLVCVCGGGGVFPLLVPKK